MPYPLISVIIGVYNGERFVARALESIARQTADSLEVIVVDDGSTDNTKTVVQRYRDPDAWRWRLRYSYQQNQGLPAAHNQGLALAKGDIVGFLDADDLWPDDKLTRQLPHLVAPASAERQRPDIVLGRQRRFVDGANVSPRELAQANDRPYHYSLGSTLFAREVFDKVGPFDESLHYNADWDWFLRARQMSVPMVVEPYVTLLVRVHTGNMTRQRDAAASYTIRMVKKHLASRGALNSEAES